jgi:hypothetical protein
LPYEQWDVEFQIIQFTVNNFQTACLCPQVIQTTVSQLLVFGFQRGETACLRASVRHNIRSMIRAK